MSDYTVTEAPNFFVNEKTSKVDEIGISNEYIAFQYLFGVDDLYQKNRILQDFLDSQLSKGQEGLRVIKRFLNDSSIYDLHPSLMQSTLLFTEHIKEYKAQTDKLRAKMLEILPSL